MLKIYGSMLCPDCVQCRADLDKAGMDYEYLDFAEDLLHLKTFLSLREGAAFDDLRSQGKIGIPCIVDEDGNIRFSWEEYM